MIEKSNRGCPDAWRLRTACSQAEPRLVSVPLSSTYLQPNVSSLYLPLLPTGLEGPHLDGRLYRPADLTKFRRSARALGSCFIGRVGTPCLERRKFVVAVPGAAEVDDGRLQAGFPKIQWFGGLLCVGGSSLDLRLHQTPSRQIRRLGTPTPRYRAARPGTARPSGRSPGRRSGTSA